LKFWLCNQAHCQQSYTASKGILVLMTWKWRENKVPVLAATQTIDANIAMHWFGLKKKASTNKIIKNVLFAIT
jgi:hypothetical protein